MYSDALAPARETMRRARWNIETLIPRLIALGYQFSYGWGLKDERFSLDEARSWNRGILCTGVSGGLIVMSTSRFWSLSADVGPCYFPCAHSARWWARLISLDPVLAGRMIGMIH